MAYNFSAVQRISDGKYLLNTGEWGTLDFTSNYTRARFYYGDADDVSNFLSSYPSGDYRVIEYWMPGDTKTNLPKSNNTVLNNFLGSPGGANSVTVNAVNYNGSYDRMVVTVAAEYDAFLSDWNANGGRNGFVIFTQSQVDSLGIRGAAPTRDYGLSSFGEGFFAAPIASTNSSPRSGGYRRIVWSGAYASTSYSGQVFQFAFL